MADSSVAGRGASQVIDLRDGREPEITWEQSDALDVGSVRVSVVIPTLNEAENLPHVMPYVPDWVHEIVIVDGASTDDTVAVAQSLSDKVRIVMERRPGKGAALRAGFAAATGDIVVMLDADGSMDPREMHGFVGVLLSGADLVKGSRFCVGGGSCDITLLRRLGNAFFTQSVRMLWGPRYTDLCYGYVAFWSDVPEKLALDGDGFEIETMIGVRALKAGLRVAEAPSFERERIHGESNLRTFRDGWRVLKVIVAESRLRPRRLAPAPVAADRLRRRHDELRVTTAAVASTA